MKKVEHIGIAVKDLASANDLFTRLFNQPYYKQEELVSEGVSTSFFKVLDRSTGTWLFSGRNKAWNPSFSIVPYNDESDNNGSKLVKQIEKVNRE